MNKVIHQLGFGFLALYLILFGALGYWQVISSEQLSGKAGNNRAILRQYERPHTWITMFAPVEEPRYAVTVVVKGTNDGISASTGGKLAGAIAKAMLDTAFSRDD